MKIILGIIFAPMVAMVAIKMALDMNRPSKGGRKRKRRWSWK